MGRRRIIYSLQVCLRRHPLHRRPRRCQGRRRCLARRLSPVHRPSPAQALPLRKDRRTGLPLGPWPPQRRFPELFARPHLRYPHHCLSPVRHLYPGIRPCPPIHLYPVRPLYKDLRTASPRYQRAFLAASLQLCSRLPPPGRRLFRAGHRCPHCHPYPDRHLSQAIRLRL
jgi:hypothetical protein